MAEYGVAPILHGVVNIGYGDWKMIVMEDVGFLRDIHVEEMLSAELLQAPEKYAIDCLHKHGYVHGDLRFTTCVMQWLTKNREFMFWNSTGLISRAQHSTH